MTWLRNLLFCFLFLACSTSLAAKAGSGEAGAILTLGNNYISRVYSQAALYSSYSIKGFNASLITGVGASGRTGRVQFMGFTAETAYTIPIPHFPLEFRLIYNFYPHWNSTIMEHDVALLGSYQGRHVATGVGYQLRYNRSLDGMTKFVEASNLIYMLKLYVWAQNTRPYNISIAVQNYDYFNYNVNPLIILSLHYTLKKGPRIALEGLYQGAGFAGILFNHFDWKMRIGVLWAF